MNMMAYHRSDDITIDLMATAIWPPHLVDPEQLKKKQKSAGFYTPGMLHRSTLEGEKVQHLSK